MKPLKIISLFVCILCLLVGCNSKESSGSVNKEPHLEISETSIALNQDEEYTLVAEMKNGRSSALSNYSWYSSNEDVATVSYKGGVVTAIGVGTAVITAVTTFNDKYTAQCVVTVTREPGFDYEIGQADGKVQDDYYRFYIPVKNTGKINICLYRMKYQIQNKYGDVLNDSEYTSMSAYPKIIAPGETGYFYTYEYNFYGSFEDKTSDDLVVIQHPVIKKAKNYRYERYQVSEANVVQSDFGSYYYIKGSITNNSQQRIVKPYLALHIFDQNNRFVYCLTRSFQEGIEPGVTKEYSVEISNYGGNKIDISEIARIQPIAFDNVDFES